MCDGEPWFVAADVCAEDKANHSLGLPGRDPLIVNESGMYALIFGS